MKTYFTPIAALILFFSISTADAQSAPELTLVTTLQVSPSAPILFEPEGDLQIDYWDQQYAKVVISINSEFGRSQLKALLQSGLFRLEARQVEDHTRITMPQFRPSMTIGGKLFDPTFAFFITLPRGIEIKHNMDL